MCCIQNNNALCHLRDFGCMCYWLNFRAPDEETKAYFPWVWICMISSLKMDIKYQERIAFKQFSFASLPLKYLSLQAASHFNLLPTSGDTAGTDVPVQVLWAIMDSFFHIGTGKLRMLQSVDELCPPPELGIEKLTIPPVGYKHGNLRFLKFGSFC